jgi:hypothetical protein
MPQTIPFETIKLSLSNATPKTLPLISPMPFELISTPSNKKRN